jgi:hypothetical protein
MAQNAGTVLLELETCRVAGAHRDRHPSLRCPGATAPPAAEAGNPGNEMWSSDRVWSSQQEPDRMIVVCIQLLALGAVSGQIWPENCTIRQYENNHAPFSECRITRRRSYSPTSDGSNCVAS